MAGILAATISSSDSYLLIAASAFAKNIYQGVVKKDADDKKVLTISSDNALIAISSDCDCDCAWMTNSVIFKIGVLRLGGIWRYVRTADAVFAVLEAY